MRKINPTTRPTHSSFKLVPGTVVRLVHDKGCIANEGRLAEVVEHSEFPVYLQQLLNTVDREDAYNYFVGIRWFPAQYPEKQEPEDGFYSKHRFEPVIAKAKG